jgi:hypothetical protein
MEIVSQIEPSVNHFLEKRLLTRIDGRVPVVMGYAPAKSYEEHRPVRLNEIAPGRLTK